MVVAPDGGRAVAWRALALPVAATNNVAEYAMPPPHMLCHTHTHTCRYVGAFLALSLAAELGASRVLLRGDSELIVRQLTRVCVCDAP